MEWVLPTDTTPLALNIAWDKISTVPGKANIIQVVDTGSSDEVYVGGYLQRLTGYPISFQQFSDSGTLRYSLYNDRG